MAEEACEQILQLILGDFREEKEEKVVDFVVDKVIKKVVSETVSNELANHLVVDAIFNNILRDMIVKKTEYPDDNQALINHTAKGAPNHQPINGHSLESRIIRDGGNSSPTKHLKNRHSLSITKI